VGQQAAGYVDHGLNCRKELGTAANSQERCTHTSTHTRPCQGSMSLEHISGHGSCWVLANRGAGWGHGMLPIAVRKRCPCGVCRLILTTRKKYINWLGSTRARRLLQPPTHPPFAPLLAAQLGNPLLLLLHPKEVLPSTAANCQWCTIQAAFAAGTQSVDAVVAAMLAAHPPPHHFTSTGHPCSQLLR
jgi:hypothetical protein